MRCFVARTGVASLTVLAAAGLAVAGCSGSTPHASAPSCSGKQAGAASTVPVSSASPGVAAAWTLPGGNLANTRDVETAITAGLNSGGGLWDPPSFDAQGNLCSGIANPGPIGETGWPKGYPWGTSRPGPDLYTDSVVKLSPAGKLLWYYQLTPHDLYDWDLQNSPLLTTANGQAVVIDGGKGGILGKLQDL